MKPLTIQEKRILDLVSQGLSSGEIARSLSLSAHTVETHRKNLLAKMEARNSADMVRRAFHFRVLSFETSAITPFRSHALRKVFLLVFLISAIISNAQNRTISGRVTSQDDGKPLPGVNVLVKGTSNGIATDAEGKYSLLLNDGGDILIFSFIGFETVEVSVNQRSIMDVELIGNVKQLSEVVVTALGYEVERDKVGSASTKVLGQAITKSGEPTLINGLSGKSSGLIINRTTGDPGSGSFIQIRGQSSITGSIQPLIVVDGVPIYNTNWGTNNQAGIAEQSRMNDINPNDIESIEVLKGASASALWGTRGGNGVIMITTKKGKSAQKKVNISYSGTYSLDEILTKHPRQTTYGQGTLGAYRTDVLTSAGYRDSWGDKISNRPGTPDSVFLDQGYFVTSGGKTVYPIVENGGKRSRQTYDPYDAIFGKGHYYDQTLSISGGDKDGNYYISIGDLDQKGIIKERSTYRRTSFRINTEKQMNDWLRIGSSIMYSRLKQQGVIFGNAVVAAMIGAMRTPPDWDNAQGYEGIYYAPNGTPFINRQLAYRNQIGRNQNPVYDNPVWSMNNDRQTRETDRFIASLQVQANPLDWLSLRVRAGVDQYSENRIGFFLPGGVAGNPPGSGILAIGTTREAQFNVDAFAQGRFKFSSVLKAGFLLGVNANQRTMDYVGGQISSFIVTSPPPFSLDNTTANFDDPFNGYSKIRASALYATADLEFKEQLFLTLTGRAENSSVFSHSNNPTFFYPSATVNWHLLRALNLNTTVLTFAKLRAGYGVVSTIPGPYNTITYWNPASVGDGFTGLSANSAIYGGGYQESTTQGNKDLRPETKSEVEAGLDLRFLKDRVSFSGTYFSNVVKDAIIPVAMAGSTGFTSRTGNVAEITNNGFETDFSVEVLRAGNFSWKVFGNWTRIRNKVTSLGENEVNFAGQGFTAVVGYPVGIFYGTPFLRQGNKDSPLVLDANGFPQTALTPSVVGDPNPEWRLGAGTSLAWKNLSLSVLFEHSHGGQVHGGTRATMVTMGTHKDTEHEVTLSPTEAATIKNYAGSTADTYGYKPNSDGSYTVRGYLHDFGGGTVLIDQAWWGGLGGGFNTPNIESFLEPAQWTKLREISLSYSLKSPAFQRRTKLTSVDFSVTGRNLVLWTEYKGNDPETNLLGPTNAQGRDYFNNPATRSLLFTIIINY